MMGETGCGKTRLLRYLCEIQDKGFGVKTLICLKVNIGFSYNGCMVYPNYVCRFMVALMKIGYILK